MPTMARDILTRSILLPRTRVQTRVTWRLIELPVNPSHNQGALPRVAVNERLDEMQH